MAVQKLDSTTAFADDGAAVAHVYWEALEGSALHRKALAFTTADVEIASEEYRVTWSIVVTTTSAEAAAEQAALYMTDSSRQRNLFNVQVDRGPVARVEVNKGVASLIEGVTDD